MEISDTTIGADGVGTEEQFLLSGSADGAIFLWAYFPLKNKVHFLSTFFATV